MIDLAAGLVMLGFAGILKLSRVQEIASSAIETSRRVARAIRDASLSDDAKERTVRDASKALLASFLCIAWRTAVAVAAALLVLWSVDASGLADSSVVAGLLGTWRGIAIALFATAVVYLVPSKRRVRTGLTQTS